MYIVVINLKGRRYSAIGFFNKADNNYMEVHVFLKGQKEPLIYKGDRIDVLDFEMEGIKYKQIRYFRKGFSKSELIVDELISKINTMQ